MEYTEILNKRSRKRTRYIRRDPVTKRVLGTGERDDFDFANEAKNYEGKLIRVDRDRVYKVENGVAIYVSSLPTVVKGKSLGWDSVIEVGSQAKKGQNILKTIANVAIAPIKGAVQLVAPNNKEVASWGYNNASDFQGDKAAKVGVGTLNVATKISKIALPLVGAGLVAKGVAGLINKDKSVASVNAGGTPVKADIITTAVTSTPTNSTLADKVLSIASKVPPSVKSSVVSNTKEVVTEKLGGWLTDATMLPKTKELKDAEKYVNSNPQSLGAQPSTDNQPLQAGVSMFNTTTIMMVIGAVILLVVISKLKS